MNSRTVDPSILRVTVPLPERKDLNTGLDVIFLS